MRAYIALRPDGVDFTRVLLPAAVSLALLPALPVPQAAPAADVPADYVHYETLAYRDRVEKSGECTRTYEVRVLLRNAAAVTQLGQLGSAYVDGYGEVRFDDVAIGKADGREVAVKDGLIEDVNPFGVTDTSISADVRFKKLTIPGLEPGDRLSYRIVVRQKPLAPGRAFGEIKLPPALGDPVQTYELDLPRDASIRVRLREGLGAAWEEVPSLPDRLVRRLSLKVERPRPDLKTLTRQLIQSWAEPDVLFTSFASWNEVGQWWWALSRERLAGDATTRAQAEALGAAGATPRQKLAALHDFVASKIRYLNVSFGIGRMQPRPAPQVLAKRYGDCKDKYALLSALAAALGIDVRPVLVSSGRSDLRDDVPAPQQFDHVVSVARLGPDPGSWLWLDSTNRYGVPGYLSADLRDKRGLLIEPSGEGRIVKTPAEPPFVPRIEVDVKGQLQPDGALRGRTVWRLRSDGEVALRAVLEATPRDRRADVVKAGCATAWKDATVTNVVVSDPSDPTEPLRLEFDAERPAPTETAKGGWSLWVPLPSFQLARADQPADEGADAVEFDEREFAMRAEIEMPEGLGARAPLSVSLDRPFGRFESIYSVEGQTLRLSRTLKLTRRSLPAAEAASYEALRRAIDTDRDQKFLILGDLAAPVLGSAASLRTAGLAALKQKDYGQAADLLRKATDADPRIENGFLDLGRALSSAGKPEEAVQAFSRQIEIAPFHESAYSWRAYALGQLNRPEEAEKDLLKQIEVTPFEAWPYETLATRRTRERRFGEAADLYARAATVQPGAPGRWVDAGWGYARDGRPEEARAALSRARSLELPDWMKISAAGVYDLIGEPAAAAELAADGLAAVEQRLAALSPEAFGEGDTWGAEYLARGWYVLGAAALAAGDTAKAERYLDAAWKMWFLPEAAWTLGTLREKQGRLADAVELWSMADTVPTASWKLPSDRQSRIDAAARKLGQGPARPALPPELPAEVRALLDRSPVREGAGARLTELRTVRLGSEATVDLAEEVLLLMGPDGSVEGVRCPSGKDPGRLDRQIARLGPIRVPFSRPDDRAFKAVRKGLLACSAVTPCALILDLPGMPSIDR